MKVLVQAVRDGHLRLVDVPDPQLDATEVLVRTSRSTLSPGTERSARELASAGLVSKARARPDLMRQVLKKARSEGIGATVRTVRDRLGGDMPLGYSGSGRVIAVGAAVEGLRPGDRVATGGAGHAELQVVSGMLAVRIPDSVTDSDAAFATLGAIALNGLRLAELGPGSRVVVIGLGVVGQLAVRLAAASGYLVAGLDVTQWAVDAAAAHADLTTVDAGAATNDLISEWTRGRGADAVLVTAASKSSEPIRRATELLRDRGTVVLVGDVGMDLERRPFYDKELQLRVARSYGPGRYDPTYETLGVDYPVGHVRWTEGRNLEAFLDLLASGRMAVDDLLTHTFGFDDALTAYEMIERREERVLGVQFTYDTEVTDRSADDRRGAPVATAQPAADAVGLIGAGNFARRTLVPALTAAGFDRLEVVTSAQGLSAQGLVDSGPFRRVAESSDALITDPAVGVVVIATRHRTHAELAAHALRAGKHVFCEKPLALDFDELDAVESAWRESGRVLEVGFNRRHSPAVAAVSDRLQGGSPLLIVYRVNGGALPDGHWYLDRREGGRLVGEGCHFIDTCAALVGHPITTVSASGTSRHEALLADDYSVALQFADGSQAIIGHASGGHDSTAKERIEVLGRGHTAVIDDFTRVEVDGKTVWSGGQDKGHNALVRSFRDALTSPVREPSAFATMSATLAAAQSLLTGAPAHLDDHR